jgi:hypothetical protein
MVNIMVTIERRNGLLLELGKRQKRQISLLPLKLAFQTSQKK